MGYKHIKIKTETYETLRLLMSPTDTFDSIINKLVDTVSYLDSALKECEKRVAEERKKIAEEKVKNAVDAIDLDKAAWYMAKIAFSIQTLKTLIENKAPQPEIDMQYRRVLKNLDQLRERYGINVNAIKDIVSQFVADPSKENKILVNEATKELFKSILLKILSLELLR